ncbi:unnamed protein product [Acanthoscelides obtectus]|uniref:Tyr recombinase domain-containing protein n=1 Tax=Acanthoscelides obtectus TaxID=200917 RepID=A0A9P0P737_ACAOB|nr:unnamed protein product [Acanthoscelides obtectus]CAK1656024.1 hypothetical protein AOBTE_LOCUS19523 [Acanthoscelides obtectus]
MPKRRLSSQDKYGEIEKLKKQFRQMQEHLNKICESRESSDSSSAKCTSTSGLRPDSQDNVGNELHEEIVVRWDSLLKKRFTKDQREELMTKFKIPSNCKVLQPHQINNEVEPCLIKSLLEHDRFMRALQQQLAHGLSAVGAVMETMMPNKEQADTMKSLVEACQLFTDVHHGLSVHLRFKVIPHLNPECKRVVDNFEIDDFLFNTKFAETMKNKQAIKKAGTDFKKKTWHSNFIGPSGSAIPNNNKFKLPACATKRKNEREGEARREETIGTTEEVQKRPQEVRSPDITARTKVSNHAEHELCVASAIEDFIKRTKSFRNTEEILILTHKKPYPASPQTISRWIKKTLHLGGVDTSVFSAHSVRHAATSAALKAGVTIDVIKNTAGWTPASNTFFNFYNGPVEDPQTALANAIVQLGSK